MRLALFILALALILSGALLIPIGRRQRQSEHDWLMQPLSVSLLRAAYNWRWNTRSASLQLLGALLMQFVFPEWYLHLAWAVVALTGISLLRYIWRTRKEWYRKAAAAKSSEDEHRQLLADLGENLGYTDPN